MAELLNRVKVGVSGTPGTGTVTLGTRDTGFQTFASAGAVAGRQYSYTIEELGSDLWESGIGTYTGTTLTRDQVYDGTNGPGVKVSFTSAAKVFVSALKQDIGGASLATLMKYGAI